MNAPHPVAAAERKGISLLEVLVACGILVIGLASVASILPAAGTRLSQAALEDRAAAAAANAYAEMVNRDLVNSVLFTGSGGPPSTVRACVLGGFPPATGTLAPAFIRPADLPAVAARIDSTRGYVLEDELVYTPPTIVDTPMNAFFSGTVGPREFRTGVSWGAMLSTGTVNAEAAVPATLSIAVFRKPGDVRSLTLTSTSGLFINGTNSGTNALQAEADRKQFLPGCSYVLALPVSSGSAAPTWLKVTSSWANPGPTSGGVEDVTRRVSYAVLDMTPIGSGTNAFISGGTLNVLAFENIVRVDQYPVTLD
jgi:type II secretory pathway pseudopilin PulG